MGGGFSTEELQYPTIATMGFVADLQEEAVGLLIGVSKACILYVRRVFCV